MLLVRKTDRFDAWLKGLVDRRARTLIEARIFRLARGNLGDVAPVGSGVSEIRIHPGPGYRVYFKRRGADVILLLAGGDKSTQTKDIRVSIQIAENFK